MAVLSRPKAFPLATAAFAALLAFAGTATAQLAEEEEQGLEQLGESRLFDTEGQMLYTEDNEPIGTIIELDGEDFVIVQPLDADRPPVAVPSEYITIVAGQVILSERAFD